MAAVLLLHLADREPGDVEKAAEIDAEDRGLVLVRMVGERLRDEDAGVVDQRVDVPEQARQPARTRAPRSADRRCRQE